MDWFFGGEQTSYDDGLAVIGGADLDGAALDPFPRSRASTDRLESDAFLSGVFTPDFDFRLHDHDADAFFPTKSEPEVLATNDPDVTNPGDITVPGRRVYVEPMFPPDEGEPDPLPEGDETLDPGGTDPDVGLENTNCVNIGGPVPDGASYHLPPHVDADYTNDAINYLASLNEFERLGAFYNMYTDTNHPHFIDFKDLRPQPTISYESTVEGGTRTTRAYEPAGNFFYGFIGAHGGIDPLTLYVAAAALQAGGPFTSPSAFVGFVTVASAAYVVGGWTAVATVTGVLVHDDPADTPHITAGILSAQAGNMVRIGQCRSGR